MPEFHNLTNKTFSKLKVLKFLGRNKHSKSIWLVKCECGEEFEATGNNLVSKGTKSCGSCVKRENLVGKKFNKLTVIELTGIKKRWSKVRAIWKCLCDCGNYHEVSTSDLNNGKIQSCGCIMGIEEAGLMDIYRKYANSTPKRIKNKKPLEFNLSFVEFKNIVTKNCYYCGSKPCNKNKIVRSKITHYLFYSGIDRIDNDLGYSLNNCVPCCIICNYAKRNYSLEQFELYLDNLCKFRIKIGKVKI